MITKTRIGNHLRRHALGDQSTFRQGFKEGVEFVLKRTPQQRTWVGLTNKEADECYESIMFHPDIEPTRMGVYLEIEAKLREKNSLEG